MHPLSLILHPIIKTALLSTADPTAPEREITMSGGERRNGWFDIYHPGVCKHWLAQDDH